MAFDYDLFVIGGGSGGVRAARVTAQLGHKVALAEDDRMGGTCVIRGCVPKKLMVFASEFSAAMRDATAYGWDVNAGAFNWQAFREKLHTELNRLEGIYQNILSSNRVTSYHARARLKSAHEVELDDGRVVSAKHILIATGGRPSKPQMPGSDFALTSNDIFNLEELPKSMLVVGGGYIASEFAGIMNGLGVNVTQIYRGEQILRGFDAEARGLVADQMRARGVDLHCGVNPLRVERKGSGYHVELTSGEARDVDQILFATGRSPNSDNLGLEELGIERDAQGAIPVDEYSQTVVPSVFAIGDVTNRVQLTPVAIREAMCFVETVFKGNPTQMDYDDIPSAIFTQPEYGAIGLTEEAARERGPIAVYEAAFRPMQHSFAGSDARMMMKLITCRETDRVLGCHIVGDAAGEMIQLVGVAVKMNAAKADFDRVVAVHPTAAEELVTMKDPVRVT